MVSKIARSPIHYRVPVPGADGGLCPLGRPKAPIALHTGNLALNHGLVEITPELLRPGVIATGVTMAAVIGLGSDGASCAEKCPATFALLDCPARSHRGY